MWAQVDSCFSVPTQASTLVARRSPGMRDWGSEGGLTLLPSLPLEAWPSGSAGYSCGPVPPILCSANVLGHRRGQGYGQHTDHQPAPGGFHGVTVETWAGPGQAGHHTLMHTQHPHLNPQPRPILSVYIYHLPDHCTHTPSRAFNVHPPSSSRDPKHTQRTTNSHRYTHATEHTHIVTHSDTQTQLFAHAPT